MTDFIACSRRISDCNGNSSLLALMGIIAVMSITLLSLQNRFIHQFQILSFEKTKNTLESITKEVQLALSDATVCEQALKDVPMPASGEESDVGLLLPITSNAGVQTELATGFQRGQIIMEALKLSSIKVLSQGASKTGYLGEIRLRGRQVSAARRPVIEKIFVYLVASANKVESCFSTHLIDKTSVATVEDAICNSLDGVQSGNKFFDPVTQKCL